MDFLCLTVGSPLDHCRIIVVSSFAPNLRYSWAIVRTFLGHFCVTSRSIFWGGGTFRPPLDDYWATLGSPVGGVLGHVCGTPRANMTRSQVYGACVSSTGSRRAVGVRSRFSRSKSAASADLPHFSCPFPAEPWPRSASAGASPGTSSVGSMKSMGSRTRSDMPSEARAICSEVQWCLWNEFD